MVCIKDISFYIVPLLSCFLPTPCFLQNLNYIHYNTNNSKLPHDIVYKLHQDRQEFLWISTDDGLVRFDGLEMKNYEQGLQSKYVISTNSEKNRLWIATWKGGIHYLENDSIRLVGTEPGILSAYYTNDILAFNDIIISYNHKSYIVYRFDEKYNILRYWQLDPNRPNRPEKMVEPGDADYYHFIKTRNHRLYGYNQTGIYEINNGKLQLMNAVICPDELWESPEGKLYYRKGGDIYLTNPHFSMHTLIYQIPWSKFENTQILSFYILPSGNICLGFAGSGKNFANPVYFLVNTRTGEIFDLLKEVRAQALSSGLLIDKEGGIWLGTDGNGLYHFFDRKYTLIDGDKTFYNVSVTDMFMLGDTLYIGTKKGIYTYYKKKMTAVDAVVGNKRYFVNRFFLTPQGTLNVSSKGLDPSYSLVPNPVRRSACTSAYLLPTYFFESKETGWGKLIDRRTKINYIHQLHLEGNMTDMEEDDQKTLWIGTTNGVFYFNPIEGCIKHEAFNNCIINDLLYQRGRGLWVGTTNGLYLVTNNKHIFYWGIKEGISNISINCLYTESLTSLWIGTQNGLFNLRKSGLAIYKKRDGLIADDVNCFARMSNNTLAVGSSKGISLFYMDTAAVFQKTPALIIEKILINGKSYNAQQNFELPFNNTITLHYNSISFTYPELMIFQYRLNTDEPWIETQNRSLVFTNLQPGDYHFMLRVKKHNSRFSPPFELFFKINAPWWKSRYFYAGLFIVGIFLLYFFFNFRLNQQKNKQQLSELRVKALQTQLNPHFISNALNAIQLFILKQNEIQANEYLTRFADLTRLLLETSRTRFIPLQTELEILNLYTSFEKLRFEDKFEYEVNIEPGIDPGKYFLPGMLIQPFVENSINHGILYLEKSTQGKLSVHIYPYNEGLKVVIEDNGIGRQKAEEIRNRNHRSYKSRSTEIANEIQQAVNSLPGCYISIETTDKEDITGRSTGTIVCITVVVHPKFYNL